MGMNLHMRNIKTGEDYPVWDYLRRPGDFEFKCFVENLDLKAERLNESSEVYYRPDDLIGFTFRIIISDLPDKKRYLWAVGIMLESPDWYLCFNK